MITEKPGASSLYRKRIVGRISEAFDHKQVKSDSIIIGESVRVVSGPSITQELSLGRGTQGMSGH